MSYLKWLYSVNRITEKNENRKSKKKKKKMYWNSVVNFRLWSKRTDNVSVYIGFYDGIFYYFFFYFFSPSRFRTVKVIRKFRLASRKTGRSGLLTTTIGNPDEKRTCRYRGGYVVITESSTRVQIIIHGLADDGRCKVNLTRVCFW